MIKNIITFPPDKSFRLTDKKRQLFQPPSSLCKILPFFYNMRVLDFGSGNGYFSLHLADTIRSLNLTGNICCYDIEPTLLDELRFAAEKLNLSDKIILVYGKENFASLPFANDTFDIILASHVVHMIENLNELLIEFKRILKSKGVVVIIEWDVKYRVNEGPPVNLRLNKKELLQLLEKNDFYAKASNIYKESITIIGQKK